MKKIFLLGILSILFASASFAQMRLGVTAGLNVSNIVENDDEGSKYKAGFQAGVIADFGITEKFSIMPELLFSQRGCKIDGPLEEGTSANMSLTLNYLQLPVNAAYKFNVGRGSKLFVFAGPYIGYGISTKASAKIETEDGNVTFSSDELKFGSKDDEVKAFDFGLNVGVGYEYGKVFFKLQYNPGLINLSNDSDVSLKNTNLAVSVGYYFL